jgi:hypothetical protein
MLRSLSSKYGAMTNEARKRISCLPRLERAAFTGEKVLPSDPSPTHKSKVPYSRG